jgi:hypothetical protein
MRHPSLSIVVAAAFSLSATAHALTCHIVFDRSDVIIYRDVVPPVDMSERGRAARAAMRQRGEYLLLMESDQCSSFVATSTAAGAAGASVDDIVSGLRSYPGAAGGNLTTAARTGSAGTSASAASASAGGPARSY